MSQVVFKGLPIGGRRKAPENGTHPKRVPESGIFKGAPGGTLTRGNDIRVTPGMTVR